jgi:hypothetical protein
MLVTWIYIVFSQLNWINVFFLETSSDAAREDAGQQDGRQVDDAGQREHEVVDLWPIKLISFGRNLYSKLYQG